MTSDPSVQSRINALKQEYETVGNEVREALGRLTPEALARKSGNASWKVQTVAAHLASAPGGIYKYTQRIRDGKNLSVPGFLINLANSFEALRRRNMTPPEMVEKYSQGHANLVAEMDKSADADWDRKVKVMGDETDLNGWFRITIDHEKEHMAQLR